MTLTGTPLIPAAKPLRADARRNRERIVKAARAVFSDQGIDAQIDDVAKRAKVGVGTVYRHFPTKHALAEALVEERFDQTIAYARELLDEPDPWRAIERSLEFCGRMQERDRGFQGVVMDAAGGPIAGPREHQRGELLALTERMLARAREAGVVRPDVRAEEMSAIYCGLASVVNAGAADWRRYAAILLDGLRPPAGGR
jgi:AcrR family transcriptional regulator